MFAIIATTYVPSGNNTVDSWEFTNKTEAREFCRQMWNIDIKKGSSFEEVLYGKICGLDGYIFTTSSKRALLEAF